MVCKGGLNTMIKKGNNIGFANLISSELIVTNWDWMEEHSEPMIVRKSNKYGVIDESGRIIVEPDWDEIVRFKSNHIPGRFSEYAVRNGVKWGLFDTKGSLTLKPLFDVILSSCKVLPCKSNFKPIEFTSVMFGRQSVYYSVLDINMKVLNLCKDLYNANTLCWFYVVFNESRIGLVDIHGHAYFDRLACNIKLPTCPPKILDKDPFLKTSISTHFGDIHLKIWRTDTPPYWDAKLYYIVEDDLTNNKTYL